VHECAHVCAHVFSGVSPEVLPAIQGGYGVCTFAQMCKLGAHSGSTPFKKMTSAERRVLGGANFVILYTICAHPENHWFFLGDAGTALVHF
jgi:hypothetical protein